MHSSLGGHLAYFPFFCVDVRFHFFEYRPRSGLMGLRIIVWRRKWQLTPVLLPGKSHGRRGLVGCSPWGLEESDTTERLHFHFSLSRIGEGNGNPLQCSCLENPMDGGAWWAAVYGVAQSRTQLKRLSSSSSSSKERSPLLVWGLRGLCQGSKSLSWDYFGCGSEK